MGLAASQARLFGITARKADCEFKAMEFAQQKLEITDQLATIANDYSNAMNSTSLLWCDAYGDSYGLTYGIMMNPSASNDYNPVFVTTSSGAIVLNSVYAAAAIAAGIPQSGSGMPSQNMRDKFIAALVPAGMMTSETAASITVVDYVAQINPKDNSKIVIDTSEDIVSDTKSVEWRSDAGLGGYIATNKGSFYVETLADIIDDPNIGGQKVISSATRSFGQTFTANGFCKSGNYATMVKNGFFTSEGNDITLGDLLSNEYVYMRDDAPSYVQKDMLQILDNVAQVLGYGEIGKGINTDASSDYALTYAYNMVKNVFLNTDSYVKSVWKSDDTAAAINNTTYVDALENNKICSANSGGAYRTSVNVSNMVAAFLSYYDNALMGTSSPYVVSSKTQDSVLITLSPDYQYIVAPQKGEMMTQTEKLGDFYDELVNNICTKGWRTDENIDDYEYLANSLKNGRYSVSTLHEDGQYYQVRYQGAGYIEELKDEDAIARAEIEYTKKKAELTYKEDAIDLKTKSLDAEIAQLNQEYETVKSLVTKNIEKAFTMYSN